MNDKTEKLQTAIETLLEKHGEVEPSALLKVATAKSSPIHECFPWNDKKAAHQHRLDLSRKYIRRCRVIYKDNEERLIHVPVSIVSTEGKEGSYKPVSVVVQSPGEFERAFEEAMSKLRAAQSAVKDLQEAAGSESETASMIAIALSGLSTAQSALSRVH